MCWGKWKFCWHSAGIDIVSQIICMVPWLSAIKNHLARNYPHLWHARLFCVFWTFNRLYSTFETWDGTHKENRFGLPGKWTIPFELTEFSVYSITSSRGVRISGSNAGYTMFWGRVQDYRQHTPLACFPFISPTVHQNVPSGFNWTLSTHSQKNAVHTSYNYSFQMHFNPSFYGYAFKVVSSLQDYIPHFKMNMEFTR